MCAENLWGSLEGFKKIKTPLLILREQAELLTQATQGILKGYIRVKSERGSIELSFYILAEQLNQYKYEVLRIVHEVKIYPVQVRNLVESKGWKNCENEAIFLGEVRSILSSQETRKIIESLLSQSES